MNRVFRRRVFNLPFLHRPRKRNSPKSQRLKLKVNHNRKHLKATPHSYLRSETKSPMPEKKNPSRDGCLTDPEPDVDSRLATVRNMRSMCRCSCVLQFTFRRAVSCDLHRPPSQVIHCIVLFFSKDSLSVNQIIK